MNLEKLEKMVALFEKLYWVQDNEDEDTSSNVKCALDHLAYKIAEETEKEDSPQGAFVPVKYYSTLDSVYAPVTDNLGTMQVEGTTK